MRIKLNFPTAVTKVVALVDFSCLKRSIKDFYLTY